MAETKPVPMMITQTTATVFQQQAFGPWTANDPQVQRNAIKTNAQSGSIQKKFLATYPPAPTVSEGRTAITNGFEFAINVVNGRKIAGYNVYSSITNNAAIAKLIDYKSQPPNTSQTQTLKFQYFTTANPFYWIASVNSNGQEGIRVPVSGTAAPTTVGSLRVGASSGTGAGGGAVSRKGGPVYL